MIRFNLLDVACAKSFGSYFKLPFVPTLCNPWYVGAMVCVLSSLGTQYSFADEKPSAEQIQFFESKVRPIFVDHCYECHSATADEVEAELLLDSKWGWMTGGESGPAIIPGNLEDSLVIDAVRYEENKVTAMPPRSKLSDQEIEILEKWVQMGA